MRLEIYTLYMRTWRLCWRSRVRLCGSATSLKVWQQWLVPPVFVSVTTTSSWTAFALITPAAESVRIIVLLPSRGRNIWAYSTRRKSATPTIHLETRFQYLTEAEFCVVKEGYKPMNTKKSSWALRNFAAWREACMKANLDACSDDHFLSADPSVLC